eukprot:jgi/Hompol1/3183/HPOL_006392-RA
MTASVIVIDYNDLADPNKNLFDQISAAFGNEAGCLGACFVKNVPGFVEMRARLLPLASRLAALPQASLDALVHEPSVFMQGWSHGKELFDGKPDKAKGSFYANPIHDVPPKGNNNPVYKYPNVWPSAELPELREALMDLGQLIVSVGKLVARHCDKYLGSKYPDLPPNLLFDAIEQSNTIKARLLHYFPSKDEPSNNHDSWCGLHLDHSLVSTKNLTGTHHTSHAYWLTAALDSLVWLFQITGLTSAMLMDESDPNNIKQLVGLPGGVDQVAAASIAKSGLYIKGRDGDFVQVKIPQDCLAFQIGEAAQAASRGLLVATPHLVRAADLPNVSRNTFAVFMQPNEQYRLTETMTFDEFSSDVMKRHYTEF